MSRSAITPEDPTHASANMDATVNAWRALLWLNHYRLLVSGSLTLYLLLAGKNLFIGFDAPLLSKVSAVTYLMLSTVALAGILTRRPSFTLQVHSHIFSDIVFVILIMHTSGGIISGYAMLLNIAIAGAAILVGGRTAILFASAAALAVLAEQIYSHFTGSSPVNYPLAGMLGVSYFTTAVLAHVLANRIRITETLAQQRGADLAKMATINEHIIRQLDAGIIVINAGGTIQQANQAAQQKLGVPNSLLGQALGEVSSFLDHQYQLWRQNRQYQPAITTTSAGLEIRPHFVSLGSDAESGTLLHIEDISATRQQAQKMKLMSLGRLTASIAHEIRNPLAAISHASQLLHESSNLSETDIRLTEIINTHTQRMNSIIENILQLSRRGRHDPEIFSLPMWIGQFVDEYRRDHDLAQNDLVIDVNQPAIQVTADKSQLRQILLNLVDNGLRHADREQPEPLVRIRVHTDSDGAPCLEVTDSGNGIDSADAPHIFEPFFTTRNTGTGLGLYICKELCDINGARISYSSHGGRSRFTLCFSKADESR